MHDERGIGKISWNTNLGSTEQIRKGGISGAAKKKKKKEYNTEGRK